MKLHCAFVETTSALLHTNSAWDDGFCPTLTMTRFGNSPFSHQHDGTKRSSSLLRPKEMGYCRLKRVPSSSLNGTGRLDQPVLHRRVASLEEKKYFIFEAHFNPSLIPLSRGGHRCCPVPPTSFAVKLEFDVVCLLGCYAAWCLNIHQSPLPNLPLERRPELRRGGSLKTLVLLSVNNMYKE